MNDLLQNSSTWAYLAFVIFVVLAYIKGRAAIVKALDARGARIAADIDKAHALLVSAEQLHRDAQQKFDEAEKLAAAIISQAERDAESLKREQSQKFEAVLVRKAKVIEERYAQENQKLMIALRDDVIQSSTLIAEKILQSSLIGTKSDALIDKSINFVAEQSLNRH